MQTPLVIAIIGLIVGPAVTAKFLEYTLGRRLKWLDWPKVLAQELEKARGSERQELRFASYNALWSKLRPLAVYDTATLDRTSMRILSTNLSDWYFSDRGGLMLTPAVRDLYFALQDLLRTVGGLSDDWRATRTDATDAKNAFVAFLKKPDAKTEMSKLMSSIDKSDFGARWSDGSLRDLTAGWREEIPKVVVGWSNHSPELRFAILQQAGSVLRTGMTADVESRLR